MPIPLSRPQPQIRPGIGHVGYLAQRVAVPGPNGHEGADAFMETSDSPTIERRHAMLMDDPITVDLRPTDGRGRDIGLDIARLSLGDYRLRFDG